jgi:hypothetical protein
MRGFLQSFKLTILFLKESYKINSELNLIRTAFNYFKLLATLLLQLVTLTTNLTSFTVNSHCNYISSCPVTKARDLFHNEL